MMSSILWIVSVILLDQISKYFIQVSNSLPITVVPNFFEIVYVKNTGAAWSMLSNKTALLTLISALAIGVMLWYLVTKKLKPIQTIALCLMIGGAAGNFIDRLCLSYVRDFLSFNIFGYAFPVFNIADSALCIGVFLLFLVSLMEDK